MPPWMYVSPARLDPLTVGILHDGTMMGNDRTTDRTRRKNLLELCLLLLFAGCRKIGVRRDNGAATVRLAGEESLDSGGGCGGGDGNAGCVGGGAIGV